MTAGFGFMLRLANLAFAFVVLLGGTLLAYLWAPLIILGGLPGALLGRKSSPGGKPAGSIPPLGFAVCLIGQAYAALTFCAAAIAGVRYLLFRRPDVVEWLMWGLAFVVSTMPAMFAANRVKNKVKCRIQEAAARYTVAIGALGFWAILLVPDFAGFGWGWMPWLMR